MKNKEFLVSNRIAHRGIHSIFLENTLLAFEEAMNQNYAIELDVRLTKDQQVVVFHDSNLKRIFQIDQEVRDLTLDELKKYQSIPTLIEVLELVKGKVPLLIEIKYDNRVGVLEKKISELLDYYSGEYAIMSFNPLSVLWFRLNRPHYVRGYLVHSLLPDNFLLRFFLNPNLLKYMIQPDFLGINLVGLEDAKLQKLRKKYPIIGYTIKNKQQLEKYLKAADNFIYDDLK